MITNNSYYRNEIYIPHAKPSITSDVTTVSADLDFFIAKYERECLIRCLGFPLFSAFNFELDAMKPNGLKDTANVKWNLLLNGEEYFDTSGKLRQWRGVRFKNNESEPLPTRSFLANYVFFHYEENYDSFRSGVGYVKPKAANATERSPAQKAISAWRDMVYMIQGRGVVRRDFVTNFGYGVDYYNEDEETSLYQYIKDTNSLIEGTYPDFKPHTWDVQINQFGI